MRIISGNLKGRRFHPPKKLPVRPTTDMAKEGLFNILNNQFYFDELKVLDLFAGTGSISLEFASRGSEDITAVDKNFGCVKYIRERNDEFDLDIKTVKSDVYNYLESTSDSFDLIFADPPYDFDNEQFEKIHQLIFENNLLNDGGLLIIEHSKHTDLSSLNGFNKTTNYGGSVFAFFE